MFSHIFVGVTDFDQALVFYDSLMKLLGNELCICEAEKPWAGWHAEGNSRPLFVICKPYNGEAHQPGNGQMVAFIAKDRKTVQAAYQAALERGGKCEGPPGVRSQYHPDYYGAYFRYSDGNKLCVACHQPEIQEPGVQNAA